MKNVIPLIVTLALCVFIFDSANAQLFKKNKLKTEADSISYAIGISMGETLKKQEVPDFNIDMFIKAFELVLDDKKKPSKPAFTNKEANKFIEKYFKALKERQKEENIKKGNAFLEENKSKEGVVKLESGLQYKVIKAGTGNKPLASDKVKVHYSGRLLSGKVFDSSYERGEPISFGVNRVIKGWQEALQLMKVGAKWEVFIPSDLAYGEQGAGGSIPPNSVLIFEVELLAIE